MSTTAPSNIEHLQMKLVTLLLFLTVNFGIWTVGSARASDDKLHVVKQFTVYPIGWIRKTDERTTIVVDKKYQPGFLGLEKFSHVWVLYWFDQNDTPEKRSILQVH